jgi:hypothetical protein
MTVGLYQFMRLEEHDLPSFFHNTVFYVTAMLKHARGDGMGMDRCV